MELKSATCTAPVNIAVIKYWGKRDEKLILPINSSLSGTLSQEQLQTKTTAAISPSFDSDRIWLNRTEEDIQNPRLQNCLREIRRLAKSKQVDQPEWVLNAKIRICSENNFPTAAGLASSAAGYACLVFTLAKLFGVDDSTEEITKLARVGSGSACRSIYGGFVRWNQGTLEDGSDSIAEQVISETYWPEIEVLILVVSDHKKTTSSTSGMQTSVDTSDLIKHRADVVVPERMRKMEESLRARDFETFGRITMQDSNQFHAVCLDTYPPIFYLNDVSKGIIDLITKYNAHSGKIKAAYTFDAGPNAVIYLPRENVDEVVSLVRHYFPSSGDQQFVKGFRDIPSVDINSSMHDGIKRIPMQDSVKYIIHTKIGTGPQVLSSEHSLLDTHGNPKSTK